MASEALSLALLAAVVDEVSIPILLINGARVLFSNAAASEMRTRLKADYAINLDVLVRDHLETIATPLRTGRVVTQLTASNGEPFYIHAKVLQDDAKQLVVLVTIRALAPDRAAFTRQYQLTAREAQVVELVLRGYCNGDIAGTLGITSGTAKKHLTSVFNKLGVDSRAQLISKLA